MAFSEIVIDRAWSRSGGKCEYMNTSHGHGSICRNNLTRDRHDGEGYGAWQAQYMDSSKGDTSSLTVVPKCGLAVRARKY